jgi:hypothetical protein
VPVTGLHFKLLGSASEWGVGAAAETDSAKRRRITPRFGW